MTGAIAAAQYYIAQVAPITVQLHNHSISDAEPTVAVANYIIASNGHVTDGFGDVLESWLTGTGASSSNYEAMATQTSGVAVSGTLGSWINCSTGPSWQVSNSNRTPSVKTGVISVQIRDTATHTVQASASITLSAEITG